MLLLINYVVEGCYHGRYNNYLIIAFYTKLAGYAHHNYHITEMLWTPLHQHTKEALHKSCNTEVYVLSDI